MLAPFSFRVATERPGGARCAPVQTAGRLNAFGVSLYNPPGGERLRRRLCGTGPPSRAPRAVLHRRAERATRVRDRIARRIAAKPRARAPGCFAARLFHRAAAPVKS